ncbi:MAG: hypothetical protein WC959_06250 [Kiritimatiellales bacterium]
MSKLIKTAVTILGITISVCADTTWNNNGGDQVWTNAANWTAGIPGPADVVTLSKAISIQPIFSVGMSGTVSNVLIGMAGGNTAGFLMTGGALAVNGTFNINQNNNANHQAKFEMTGGNLTVSQNFRVGMNHNNAEFIMSGGNISVGYFNLGSNATVSISGGTFEIQNNWVMNGTHTAIDLCGGTIVFNNANGGDGTFGDIIQGYIDAGYIVGYGGTEALNVEKNGDVWTITAVPEASSITLFLISSVSIIGLRKKL